MNTNTGEGLLSKPFLPRDLGVKDRRYTASIAASIVARKIGGKLLTTPNLRSSIIAHQIHARGDLCVIISVVRNGHERPCWIASPRILQGLSIFRRGQRRWRCPIRWFKHLALAHEDEAMIELISICGVEAYGVWWIILEKIAHHMDKTDRCELTQPTKRWASNCGVSVKKLTKILEILRKSGKISVEIQGNFCRIECRNMLKFRDEYSKKSGHCPN